SGLTPTIYGHSFIRHMRILQADLERAQTEIAELKGASIGHVRMGASPTVAASILPSATFELYAKGRGIHITAVEAAPHSLVRLVRNAEIEFAICTEPHAADTAGLTVETLFQDRYVLVASGGHELCRKSGVTLDDVQAFPFILTGK